MKVSNKILKNVSLIYILLPIICFFIGYLRIYISCFLIWRLYTKSNAKESIAKDEFFISKKVFITIILFSLLFIFISGICNITYQPNFFPDYLIRNNIFRDLIFKNNLSKSSMNGILGGKATSTMSNNSYKICSALSSQ